MGSYFLGVDVGTGSARVGVFTEEGQLISVASKEIKIHSPFPGVYEQSSQDIWQSIVQIVQVSSLKLNYYVLLSKHDF